MRLAIILSSCFLWSLRAQTPFHCESLPGADLLWSKNDLRFVLVGEIHGTAESPQVFLDLVCSAAKTKRPIVVGLERPSDEQPLFDEFMTSKKHQVAAGALLKASGWNMFDGRSSQAMLALLEALRDLKLRRRISEVVAFDDSRKGETSEQREQRMAARLQAAADQRAGALVIALTGNLHASKTANSRFGSYPWMAMLLPGAQTFSVLITDKGGEAWIQTTEGCAPRKLRSTGGEQRGLTLTDADSQRPGFDGILATGRVSTASSPAFASAPPPPACSKE